MARSRGGSSIGGGGGSGGSQFVLENPILFARLIVYGVSALVIVYCLFGVRQYRKWRGIKLVLVTLLVLLIAWILAIASSLVVYFDVDLNGALIMDVFVLAGFRIGECLSVLLLARHDVRLGKVKLVLPLPVLLAVIEVAIFIAVSVKYAQLSTDFAYWRFVRYVVEVCFYTAYIGVLLGLVVLLKNAWLAFAIFSLFAEAMVTLVDAAFRIVDYSTDVLLGQETYLFLSISDIVASFMLAVGFVGIMQAAKRMVKRVG